MSKWLNGKILARHDGQYQSWYCAVNKIYDTAAHTETENYLSRGRLFLQKVKVFAKKKERDRTRHNAALYIARANTVKTHSSAPLLVNVNVLVRWLNLTERMQAAQCNWRIVKDWKNSLFTFFTLCYFSDRDAFNSLIPYLGKNISFPVIGRLKNPAWFLGCRVPLYWTESWGSDWFGNTTLPIFFAAYWLTSVFCGCLLTNTYTKKLLNSDWLRKECSSSVTRVQTV